MELNIQTSSPYVYNRKPVPQMTANLWGKLFGDRGYIRQKLFAILFENGIQLVTKAEEKYAQSPDAAHR